MTPTTLTLSGTQAHSGAVAAIAVAGFRSPIVKGGHDHPFSRGLFCVRSSVLHMVSRAMGGFGLPVSFGAGLRTRCSARRHEFRSSNGEYITPKEPTMAQNSLENQEINRLRAELRVQKALSQTLFNRLLELQAFNTPIRKPVARRSGLRVINGGAI